MTEIQSFSPQYSYIVRRWPLQILNWKKKDDGCQYGWLAVVVLNGSLHLCRPLHYSYYRPMLRVDAPVRIRDAGTRAVRE